jgi:hypothetical protein
MSDFALRYSEQRWQGVVCAEVLLSRASRDLKTECDVVRIVQQVVLGVKVSARLHIVIALLTEHSVCQYRSKNSQMNGVDSSKVQMQRRSPALRFGIYTLYNAMQMHKPQAMQNLRLLLFLLSRTVSQHLPGDFKHVNAVLDFRRHPARESRFPAHGCNNAYAFFAPVSALFY